MQRILRSSAAPIQLLTYDANGTLADPSSQPTTADVVDSAAVAVTGSPYGVTRDSVGTYHITLAASLATLDTYQVTWNSPDGTKRYTEFEMVGGFYFTIAEIRAKDAQITATPDAIRTVRSDIEEYCEQRVELAFVPRGRRYTVAGDGTANLMTPDVFLRSVSAASIDGVALAGADLTGLKVFDYGLIQRPTGVWTSSTSLTGANVSVLYEYGMAEPPGPLKRVALEYARHLLLPSAYDDSRLIAYSTDITFNRLEVARRGSSGFPDIDSVIDLYRAQRTQAW